jgi:hypothetical protein
MQVFMISEDNIHHAKMRLFMRQDRILDIRKQVQEHLCIFIWKAHEHKFMQNIDMD